MLSSTHRFIRTNETPPETERGTIIADILGGGCGLNGTFYTVLGEAGFGVLTDVQGELKKYELDSARIKNHILLPLPERDTTNSLLASAYGTDLPALQHIGTAFSTEGMGQRGGVGACAGSQQLNSQFFQAVVSKMTSLILLLSGGELLSLWLRFFGSGSGGTFSLFQILLSQALVESLEKLGVPIKISFQMVDSLSFEGLGENIHKNQAIALNSIKEIILANQRRPKSKVVYELRLIGSPPCGPNASARQEYQLLDRQAWFNSAMRDYRQTDTLNNGLTHRFGNIVHSSTDYHTSIPRKLVAATIATDYYFCIKQAIESIIATPDMVDRVEPNRRSIELNRSSILNIIDGCQFMSATEMVSATMRPGFEHDYDFSIVDIKGDEYRCDQVAEHFTTPPTTLDAAVSNASIVLTLEVMITQELTVANEEIAILKSDIRKQQRRALRSYRRVQSSRVLINRARTIALQEGEELRRMSDQLHAHQAVRTDLEKSLRSIKAELSSHLLRLTGIANILDDQRRKGTKDDTASLFYYRDINLAFSELLTLAPLDNDRKQLVLAAQALAVSANGLQYILGANTNNVEDLSRCAIGKAFTQGAWPGAIPRAGALQVYIFPPSSCELFESMKKQMESLAPNARVYVADTLKFGINVIRFHIFHPKTEEELLPGILADAYQSAMQSPLDVLHRLPPKNSPVAS